MRLSEKTAGLLANFGDVSALNALHTIHLDACEGRFGAEIHVMRGHYGCGQPRILLWYPTRHSFFAPRS